MVDNFNTKVEKRRSCSPKSLIIDEEEKVQQKFNKVQLKLRKLKLIDDLNILSSNKKNEMHHLITEQEQKEKEKREKYADKMLKANSIQKEQEQLQKLEFNNLLNNSDIFNVFKINNKKLSIV